jgi:hypothetical protein
MTADCCRDLSAFPLLRALAERELPLRRGNLATVVFLQDRNERGQVQCGPTLTRMHWGSSQQMLCCVTRLERSAQRAHLPVGLPTSIMLLASLVG